MTRAVFLDRDGVLNRGLTRDGRPWAPFSLAELDILPGVPEALARLRSAGFQLIVVTNQPDVARGNATRAGVESIHEYMRQNLPLDDILVCYHDDLDGCSCRKPQPGMIFAAAYPREIALARSFMIGDRWRDVGAGKAAGCRTILVNAMVESTRIEPDVELADLPAAVAWILTQPTDRRKM